MVKNVQKWSKIVTDGQKWSEMVRNGQRWSEMAKIANINQKQPRMIKNSQE